MKNSQHKHPLLIIALITLGTYFLTKVPPFDNLRIQFAFVSILLYLGYIFIVSKMDKFSQTNLNYYLLILTVLAGVGATGWFYSPFFFALYLVGIFLSFIFSVAASIVFALLLVALFSFNIGEVDLAYDFLVVLSLLTTIPLSIYLRKEYIKLREKEKEILVLKKEEQKYHSKVEEVLDNRINNFAVNLRQPINDIKLLGYRLHKVESLKDLERYTSRIIIAAEEALSMLRSFEEDSTGKKLLTTPAAPVNEVKSD